MRIARQHGLAVDPHADAVDAADRQLRLAGRGAGHGGRGICDGAVAIADGCLESDGIGPGVMIAPFDDAAVGALLPGIRPRRGLAPRDVEAVAREVALECAGNLPSAD